MDLDAESVASGIIFPHRDTTDERGAPLFPPIDLVYGGFPCQDVSVAGRRAGLGGERSGEWFEFHRVLRELRPRWAVVENVPGLLSSRGGADFATILAGLGDLGFDAAWTVLDAQHFGVPQRRRRVFIVAGPRGRGPEQVLSLCESCGGHPAAGGAARQDVAGTLSVGLARSGGATAGNNGVPVNLIANPLGSHNYRLDLDHDTYVADTVRSHPRPGSNSVGAIAIRMAQTGSNGWGVGVDEQGYTLDSAQVQAVASPHIPGVRRLTPRETERLMGWPDDHTRWTAGGREVSDSQRYRMTGNGVVSTVAEWIGHRLMAVAS